MGGFESKAAAWLAANAEPGETVRSWATLGYPNPSGLPHGWFDGYLSAHGLSVEEQVAVGYRQMFAVVTERRLLLGSIGGALTLKPRDLLVAEPLESCTVEWWDRTQVGPDTRFFVFRFANSWAGAPAVVNRRTNVDGFIEALGTRARRWQGG